jgi:oligopeptide transport system substrate-binding protein
VVGHGTGADVERNLKPKIILFVAATFGLLLSCNLLLPGRGTGSSDLAATYGVDRDQAIFLAAGQPRTIDPATTHGGPGGVEGHIFSGLVMLDTDLQVQPDLAAGWDVAEDGTLYTFYLQRNAVFHDGRAVTAADVIFSWERAAHPATASDTVHTYLGDIVGVGEMLAGATDHISGLRALDDHTLEVRIDAPKVTFLAKLTYPVAFIVDRNNVAEPDWQYRANGSGPFRLEVWRDDEILVLARNDRYYGRPAAVQHVVYLMGAGIPLSLYETGQIDVVGISGSSLERVQDPNNLLSSQLRTGINMCTSFIGLNSRIPPFADPRVRQAFNYAVDKELLIETLHRGNALPAVGLLPPGMPGYNGRQPGYPYDPEKARALLAQAGYEEPADFPVLTYSTAGYGDVGSLVTAVITMWQQDLGVTIEPLLVDPYIYYDELYAGNVGDLFSFGWCADYPDPENFLDVILHSESRQNLGGYHNPALDRLLEEARVEPDVTTRMAQYAEIEAHVVEDAPVIFLSHSLAAVLVKEHVHNYEWVPISVPQWHRVLLRR